MRFLRRLVTALTATMIIGLLTIVALLVIRLGAPSATLPLPQEINMPDAATAVAFTRGPNWYAVVTAADEILIFDLASGDLQQRIQIAGN